MAKRTKSHVTIMIAEAAYYRAEKRNFEPGYEVSDWLEAEQEILSLTKNSAKLVSTNNPIQAPTVTTTKKQAAKTTFVAPAKRTGSKGRTAGQVK